MTLIRQDDVMVAVETTSAIVDFATILKATKVVYDNHTSEAPWDNCDGLDHKVETATHSGKRDIFEMQGHCFCDNRRESIVITLPDEDWGIFNWQRSMGATRQVAQEAVASDRKQRLAQLVDWYTHGWQWYGVRCDFKVLGHNFRASVWGIDDGDYARREVVHEIANEVADQFEKAGFTVTDRPERGPYPTRETKQTRIRRNLNLQNWTE